MKEKLNIREYKPRDKPKLLDILKQNVPKYFAETEIKDLEEYLEHKIEKYFVIEAEEQIIGAGGINIEHKNKIGKISWDFIAPQFQGKGGGKKLLEYRIELLKSMRNVETIIVRTTQLAYKFYEKNGFVIKETVKDYWASGFDLYYMEYQKHI